MSQKVIKKAWIACGVEISGDTLGGRSPGDAVHHKERGLYSTTVALEGESVWQPWKKEGCESADPVCPDGKVRPGGVSGKERDGEAGGPVPGPSWKTYQVCGVQVTKGDKL